MKKEVLRLQDVTYKKENTFIFRNMTFSIMEGEIMGITPMNSYGMDEVLDVIVNNLPAVLRICVLSGTMCEFLERREAQP